MTKTARSASSRLRESWDDAAGVLGKIPLAGEQVRYAAAIKPLVHMPRAARVLEAGCGSGRILRTLYALGFRNLVGLEISSARLRAVASLGPPGVELVCSPEVHFDDCEFDAVVSAAVIEHVEDPGPWLRNLAKVTKPGGVVSIATDTYMWRWLKRLGLYRSKQPIDDAIRPSRLVRWGRNAGLRLTGCGGFVNTPDRRFYFVKQLLSALPVMGRLVRRHMRRPTAEAARETESILEAVEGFPDTRRQDRWGCIFSYECYYWFQKC